MNNSGSKILIVILTVVPVAVLFYLMLMNRPPDNDAQEEGELEKREAIVLGRELAAAHAKEAERLQRTGGATDSPFPDGAYERREGELGLLNPSPQDFDQALRKFCAEFATGSQEERAALREAIPMDQFYTLMSFADRSAVFALREQDAAILHDGLSALAIIDAQRTDYRDILMSLALLNHSAERLNIDTAAAFESAAKLAEPRTAELLRSFVKRDPRSKALGKSWGYREVELDSGIGFVSSGFAPYEPQFDLVALGMGFAAALDADELYQARSVEIASKLQPIWLSGVDDQRVEEILSKASAGMSVRAGSTDRENNRSEKFVFVFTVELDSPESARTLVEISKKTKREGTSTLGFAEGNVFSLIVARSMGQGVEPIEKGDSLERFYGSFGKALTALKEIDAR